MADIKALDVYYWTATLRSFSAAADKCNITQSAVSQRIAALENEFGNVLMLRKNRSFDLTAKGIELLTFAEQFLRLQSEMTAVMTDKKETVGSIRLGCVESIAHTWLDNFVCRMNEIYPFVNIDVSIGTSIKLQGDLQNAKIDIAFLVGPSSHHDFIEAPIGQMKLAWVASTAMQIVGPVRSVDDLASSMVVTYSRDTIPYKFLKSLFSEAGHMKPKICGSDSLTTILKMISSGAAVGLIPREIVEEELHLGRLKVLDAAIQLPVLSFFASYYSRFTSDVAMAAYKIAQAASSDWHSSRCTK